MRLEADKSEVMSFEEGFAFLGEDFGPRYPPHLADHRVVEPDRRVIYVGVQGARVRTEDGRILVESPSDEELLDVPSGQVGRLVVFGSVGVSAGFRTWALLHDVDQVFCSRRGSYFATLPAAVGMRVDRIRA